LHYCLCESYKELRGITTETTSAFIHDSSVNKTSILVLFGNVMKTVFFLIFKFIFCKIIFSNYFDLLIL